MSEKQHALRTPATVQRKCGCGGSCAPCADEKKKKNVQRHALGDTHSEIPRSVNNILGSAGQPLDAPTRTSMESRFGHNFANVRVHTDSHAAESAKDINAAAYTSGTHIVFGPGRFAPHTATGSRLLAHELAHVVQQRSGTALPSGIGPADDAHERAADRIADLVVAQGPAIAPPLRVIPSAPVVRRKREDEEPATAEEEAHRLIVEDSASPAAGQMRRSDFVALLDAAICQTSREEMSSLGRSTDGCPLLEQWRPRIRAMSTRQLEVSIRRWIEPDAQVRNARMYIPRITARLARSIRLWGATGKIEGVPPDLMDLLGGGTIKLSVGGLIKGAIGSLFRKSRDGAPAPATNAALDTSGGRPLDATVASRMSTAFGRDFTNVRVHTGAEAGAAVARVNARAFTIGTDIAFGNGEYTPGTPIGDALLAHELAHVAQQEDAPAVMTKSGDATTALERDADDAAVGAVVSLWPNVRRWARDVRRNAMPRLKSSLRLQRCSSSPEEMQEYLQGIDKKKGPLKTGEAAKRARDVSKAWGEGDPAYFLTVRRKIVLIRQLLNNGPTSGDEEQILYLLERSETPDLEQILGDNGVAHKDLLTKFKEHKVALWRFYRRRYPLAYPLDMEMGEAEPAPSAPSLELLNHVTKGKPDSERYSIVQFGDELPETTRSSQVKTSRKLDTLQGEAGRNTAIEWITGVYGKFIGEKTTQRVSGAKVEPRTRPFDEVKAQCVAEGKSEEDCQQEEKGVEGMYVRSTNTVHVHTQRNSPETMVHEILHAFSDPKVETLGRYVNEGMTEFFTRRVILTREEGLYLGGLYAQPYDAIQELAIVTGEELIARAYFEGAIDALRSKVGEEKFRAWLKAMEKKDNSAEATSILRAECAVGSPKPCASYEDWIASFPLAETNTNTLAEKLPKDLQDLIAGSGTTPDCADVAMILRHYYLKKRSASFEFKAGQTADPQKFKLGQGADLNKCLGGVSTMSFQEERKGWALVDFYKTEGKPSKNLKAIVDAGLKAGDMFVWKRATADTGYEGHAQTVREVTDATVVVVQGNMSSGRGVGQLQQRTYSFSDLTNRDDGNGDILDHNGEAFFGAGPWKGPK